MNPENAPNQSAGPASLPPLPLQPAAVSSEAVQAPAPSSALQRDQVIVQAKALLQQYQADPHGLSEALRELKASYLANQFHITPNVAEN